MLDVISIDHTHQTSLCRHVGYHVKTMLTKCPSVDMLDVMSRPCSPNVVASDVMSRPYSPIILVSDVMSRPYSPIVLVSDVMSRPYSPIVLVSVIMSTMLTNRPSIRCHV